MGLYSASRAGLAGPPTRPLMGLKIMMDDEHYRPAGVVAPQRLTFDTFRGTISRVFSR